MSLPAPYWRSDCGRYVVYHGDNAAILPHIRADLVIADPPYGCDKAVWDSEFPTAWYAAAKAAAPSVYVVTGSAGLRDSVSLVGDDFVDVVAARNLNGMTRGPLGFGNWLAAVVAGNKPKQGPNAFDFVVRDDMPDHPSPKPIEYMDRLVARVAEPEMVVCDPFMGSGTTGVSCVKRGCRFIGIEIEQRYCDIAVRRIREEANHLFAGGAA